MPRCLAVHDDWECSLDQGHRGSHIAYYAHSPKMGVCAEWESDVPRITRKVAGKDVPVSIDSVWPAICRIITLARLAAFTPGVDEAALTARRNFLKERLTDVEDLEFHPEG